MNNFKIEFLHTDGTVRNINIESFDKERASMRFEVNWGVEMKILNITQIQ